MATRRGRRTGTAALAVLVAAGVAIAGVLLAEDRSDAPTVRAPSSSTETPRTDTGAPRTDGTSTDGTSAGSAAPDGTVVFDRTGQDLPGGSVLDRCRSDGRATVAAYDTAALGDVVMQCGNQSQGYEHIRVRHTGDWSDLLRGRGSRDWDDLMLTAVQTALTTPRAGLPVDAGDGKVCYSAPVRFDDGTAPAEPWVKVIVSATTDRVITAYPTDRQDC